MKSKYKNEHIQRFKDELGACIECGNCTFWCPVYGERPIEAYVARGKRKIIQKIMCGEADYNEKANEVLGMCTLCGTCAMHCPVDCKVQSLIVAARADQVTAKGIPFLPRLIYRQIISRRILFGNVVRLASWFQRLFARKGEGTIRHLPLFLSALGEGRLIPSIAPKFLRQIVPEVNKPSSGNISGLRVGYFAGCSTEFIFPNIGKKTIDLLTSHGVEVIVPRQQGCCGAPVWLGAGDFETGRKLADRTAEVFSNVDYVITSCATCASALKDYEKYLGDTEERVVAYTELGKKVRDVSEFLVDVLQIPLSEYQPSLIAKGKTITWHDPCHLVRYLGVKEQPRAILKSLPGVKYVEMTGADRCCGMAGSFSIYHYDVSKAIAEKKAENIRDTEADIVATGCPGCMIQLMDAADRNQLHQKVRHIVELLE